MDALELKSRVSEILENGDEDLLQQVYDMIKPVEEEETDSMVDWSKEEIAAYNNAG